MLQDIYFVMAVHQLVLTASVDDITSCSLHNHYYENSVPFNVCVWVWNQLKLISYSHFFWESLIFLPLIMSIPLFLHSSFSTLSFHTPPPFFVFFGTESFGLGDSSSCRRISCFMCVPGYVQFVCTCHSLSPPPDCLGRVGPSRVPQPCQQPVNQPGARVVTPLNTQAHVHKHFSQIWEPYTTPFLLYKHSYSNALPIQGETQLFIQLWARVKYMEINPHNFRESSIPSQSLCQTECNLEIFSLQCKRMKNEAGVLYDKRRKRNTPDYKHTLWSLFTQQTPRFSAQGNVRLNSLGVSGWRRIITFHSQWIVLRGFHPVQRRFSFTLSAWVCTAPPYASHPTNTHAIV